MVILSSRPWRWANSRIASTVVAARVREALLTSSCQCSNAHFSNSSSRRGIGQGCIQPTTLARVVGHQFRGVMLYDLATAIGGALEGRVVDDHQLAVPGQVQVQLATTHAVLEAFFEAGQGVFRCFAFGAAVAVDQGHIYSLQALRRRLISPET